MQTPFVDDTWCAAQDSWSDVQLLLAINACLVVLGGWAKGAFVDPLESGAPHNSLWTNTYEARQVAQRQRALWQRERPLCCEPMPYLSCCLRSPLLVETDQGLV